MGVLFFGRMGANRRLDLNIFTCYSGDGIALEVCAMTSVLVVEDDANMLDMILTRTSRNQ